MKGIIEVSANCWKREYSLSAECDKRRCSCIIRSNSTCVPHAKTKQNKTIFMWCVVGPLWVSSSIHPDISVWIPGNFQWWMQQQGSRKGETSWGFVDNLYPGIFCTEVGYVYIVMYIQPLGPNSSVVPFGLQKIKGFYSAQLGHMAQ